MGTIFRTLGKYKAGVKAIRCNTENLVSLAAKHRISSSTMDALIVAEDHRFWYHPGVDIIALIRAIWKTIVVGKCEGGSTVAMQYVRVITGNYEKTLERKTLEIALAIKATSLIPKEDILKCYLMVAYYGWKMDGLQQACDRMKLNMSDLNPSDAASIVARIKYPEPRYAKQSRKIEILHRIRYIEQRLKRYSVTKYLKKSYHEPYNSKFTVRS